MLAFKVTAAPEEEPVSLAEAKAHLRVDTSDEDTRIGQLIQAARERVEEDTCRALIDQGITYYLDGFPCSTTLRLPRPSLRTVTSISYLDTAGDTQVYDSSKYVVDGVSEPGRIVLKDTQSWPLTLAQANAVTIVYSAGWDDAAAVPAALKEAMLLLIGDAFTLRRETMVGVSSQARRAYEALIAPYRVRYW